MTKFRELAAAGAKGRVGFAVILDGEGATAFFADELHQDLPLATRQEADDLAADLMADVQTMTTTPVAAHIVEIRYVGLAA